MFLKLPNHSQWCSDQKFARVAELLRSFVQITDLSNDALTQLLLYGNQDLSNDLNRNILELTLRFIHETGRFD